MIVYLGLDDTDTVDVGGTGQLARSLAVGLRAELPGCRIEGVSRHQLLQDPRVPCTRRNRCSCIVLDLEPSQVSKLAPLGRAHVLDGSVDGSDPGLCVVEEARIGAEVLEFGRRAKREIVTCASAIELARRAEVLLEPLGGTGDGVIGALAAVGLRRAGSDGWLTLWDGIGQAEGTQSVEELMASGLDGVEDERGCRLPGDEVVDTGGRVRPAVRGGRRVLLVRRSEGGAWCAVKPERGCP